MFSSVRNTTKALLGVSCVVVIGYAASTAWFSKTQNQFDTEWAEKEVSHDGGLEVSQVSAALPSGSARQKKLVDVSVFLRMLNTGTQRFQAGLNEMNRKWDISYVPMMLESVRFLPPRQRAEMIGLLRSKTGQNFGVDFDQWYQWLWKQKYTPHPQYGQFKGSLYGRIDPRFPEYFQDTADATIRLDEIRWGGVVRDGIPPLKNPKMLSVAEATYLGDNDVVFGIELNGDARCYPKRILAWHEMFKDTIGGESVCGVY